MDHFVFISGSTRCDGNSEMLARAAAAVLHDEAAQTAAKAFF